MAGADFNLFDSWIQIKNAENLKCIRESTERQERAAKEAAAEASRPRYIPPPDEPEDEDEDEDDTTYQTWVNDLDRLKQEEEHRKWMLLPEKERIKINNKIRAKNIKYLQERIAEEDAARKLANKVAEQRRVARIELAKKEMAAREQEKVDAKIEEERIATKKNWAMINTTVFIFDIFVLIKILCWILDVK